MNIYDIAASQIIALILGCYNVRVAVRVEPYIYKTYVVKRLMFSEADVWPHFALAFGHVGQVER